MLGRKFIKNKSKFFKTKFAFFEKSLHTATGNIDCRGNTTLHRLIRNAYHQESIERIFSYIKAYPLIAIKEAKIVNNNGELAYDLLKENDNIDLDSYQDLEKNLLYLMQQGLYKKINEKMSVDNDIYLNAKKDNPILQENLNIACDIGNEVRSKINFSWTHPQANDMSTNEKSDLRKKIHLIRKRIDYFSPSYEYINECATNTINGGAGNCSEFSEVAYKYFLDKCYKNKDGHLCVVTNGDHVFFAIDHQTIQSVHCMLHSPHAVICDAWLGEAFPYHLKEKKLKTYRYIEQISTYFNVIASYNPYFHSVTDYFKPYHQIKENHTPIRKYR